MLREPSRRRGTRLALYALAAVGLGCNAAAAASPFGAAAPVSDAALERARGGFILPNGMDVSIGIQIDTHVDGQLALRTVLSVVDMTRSELTVYTSTPPATLTPSSVEPGPPTPPVQSLELVPNGPRIATDLGSLRLETTGPRSAVILSAPALELQHLVGAATGVLVANTADNAVIDTIATVNLELHNSTVPIGNTLLRIETIALDAVGRGLH